MPRFAHIAAWGPSTPLHKDAPHSACSWSVGWHDCPAVSKPECLRHAVMHRIRSFLCKGRVLHGGHHRSFQALHTTSRHLCRPAGRLVRTCGSAGIVVKVALAQNLGTVRAYCSRPFEPSGSNSSGSLRPHEGHSAEAQAGTLPVVGIAWGPAAGSADGSSLLISAGADGQLRGWALEGSQACAHNAHLKERLPLAA